MPVLYQNADIGDQSQYSDEELWYIIQGWMDNQEVFEPLDDDDVKMCTDIIVKMLEETEQWYHPSTYLEDFDDEDIDDILELLNIMKEDEQ